MRLTLAPHHHDGDAAASRRDLALLGPRGALGATMLYHGIDKLRDPERSAGMFTSMGIHPGGFWSRATALAETGAGLATLLGVLVRPAALAVLVTQAVAVAKVHAPKGFPAHKGGFEFNLALMAIAGALLLGGPGRYAGSSLIGRALDGNARRSWWPVRRRRGSTLARLVRAFV